MIYRIIQNSLKEALKITTDENHLAQINKDISDLMLAKLKIDAALPIAQVAKGVHSFNSEFNKNATGQVTAVKSLGRRFFGKIIDVMNSLFENIKGLVVDKTIGVFKDQNSALKTNLDTITTHVQQYVADSTVMINSVNSLISDAIPDFSHDTTPVARITDPNYKKLEEKLKTAESQLQLLEKQVIDAYAKQQKSIVLVNDIGGKQALFTVSVELGKLAYFVKKDGTFDGQKMNDYFSQNIKELVGDDATLSALGYAKSGVGNAQENLALGKELFEGIQNKKFGDLTYDQAFSLAAFYRIKLLNASKGYVTVEANSVRDFTNLLDQGGDGMWQQIKVCMQGGIDVGPAIQKEDPTFADALAYYKNTIWFSAASINADLLQNYGNVCRTRDQLKELIAKANEALYGTVSDFPNDITVLVVDSKIHADLTTDQFSEHDPIIGQDPFIPEDTSF